MEGNAETGHIQIGSVRSACAKQNTAMVRLNDIDMTLEGHRHYVGMVFV